MKALLALGFLVTALPLRAGELSVDVRCFSDLSGKIQLEFRAYEDRTIGWVGGQVRYKHSDTFIPLVFGKTETLTEIPGRPWEFKHHWFEIVEGAVNGQYHLISQGAGVHGFSYTSQTSGKTIDLSEQSYPNEAGVCPWQ